jgi:hypothetical protein
MADDERGITELLRGSVTDPPAPITVDDLRMGARRRRALHRVAPAGAAVAVLAVVGGAIWASGHSPGGAGGTSVIATTPTPTSPPTQPNAGCPKTKPTTNVTMIDWVDFVQLNGRQFLSASMLPSKPARHAATSADLGPEVTQVTCSISDLTADHDREIDGGFLDGNAAFLPKGTPLYEVRGYDPGCRVAAVVDGKVREYLAEHEVNGHFQPMPCALHKNQAAAP